MHDVIVLLPGFVEDLPSGRQRTGCTITLVRGRPNILVDTGDAMQREGLLNALANLGLKPSDIDYVVNTHGHLDHVGNNGLFLNATFILDTDLAQRGEYWTHHFAAEPFFIPTSNGDKPARVMSTPGHTEQDLSVIVETAEGIVAIVGDLFEHEHDDTDGSWRKWSRKPVDQLASRALVRGLAQRIVPGHGGVFTIP